MTMESARTDDFEAAATAYRRELIAHCYRMTGSVHEAEDLVQETYVRAWRAYGSFEGRSSLRTWLYRIATNVCLTALRQRQRRPLPSGLGPPSADPLAPPDPASTEGWLEPIPDSMVIDELGDPADVAAGRQAVRLALIATAQMVPPRQRAAFLLCDVLDLPVTEAAGVLGVSVTALKSLLQRARARLSDVAVAEEDLAEPSDSRARHLLDRYMVAFERSDVGAIEQLLADNAVLEMTGTTTWFSGKAGCVPFIAAQAIGKAGDWRMIPVRANGQLAAAAYHRDNGAYLPFAIVVLATTTTHLTRITLFSSPSLFRWFGDIPMSGDKPFA